VTRPFLERVGLHRPELRAWVMYDWANSGFQSTIITAAFPLYFAKFAGASFTAVESEARLAHATTLALTIIALLSPMLGALADYAAIKKPLLALFTAVAVVSTGLMFFVDSGDWLLALALFVVANIGAAGSLTFYDSLLPHVARPDEIDRVSTTAYGLGYLGGGILLALNLAWILSPGTFGIGSVALAFRLSFLSVAIWWAAFAIPLFRRVREPARQLERDERPGRSAVAGAFARLAETLHELRRYRHALLMLVAYVVYMDAVNTIIRMAVVYGHEIGLPETVLIPAIMIVQFVGIPFAFAFGMLAARIGAKRSIFIALAVYTLISVLAFFMRTALHFYLLAGLVATVQGGSQALGRSLFASMIPRHRSSEFFGFFSVFEKFGGIVGPALFGVIAQATGSGRYAIISLVAFFVTAALLLARVDVPAGQRVAREAGAGTLTNDD
jgi:UMF1 family MFS transporter